MKLDVGNEIPLYRQLKEELKTAIKDGTFPYGQKIPTETELSKLFNVSRITVRRAVEELCQEDFLSKKQGKGTFVKHAKVKRKIEHLLSFGQACEANGMVSSRLVTKREVISLSSEDATTMGVSAGSPAIFIQRVNMADGFPIMCENNLYPYNRFSFLLEESLDSSLYKLLANKYQIKVTYSTDSYLDIVRAGGDVAKLLQVSNGEPLFFLYCQIYDQNHELIHIGKQYINGDQYRFYLEDYKVL
ncbi:GntR family transcriptional regulator [Lacrimispora celerecrescens]|uniref:GntR family transcriptional regulator n=1 Tax=[Clostridium] celerecrescens 18A TaxID=1286362 RepID=A0A2M8Z771_9FIRM|nr:GntR family transcriptional regulator [Lacrimispora celerecrescens]PJJ29281.1 GntR family transcriptional regulator [[Clostridium] celerecrescens 18A]